MHKKKTIKISFSANLKLLNFSTFYISWTITMLDGDLMIIQESVKYLHMVAVRVIRIDLWVNMNVRTLADTRR